MRGRIVDDQPMIPDEIRFNQSLCFSCSKFELSTIITEEMTTPFSSTRLDTSMITSLSTIITTITTTTMVTRQLDQRTGLFNLILEMRKGTDRIDQFILHFICNRSENDLDWPIDHRSCLVIWLFKFKFIIKWRASFKITKSCKSSFISPYQHFSWCFSNRIVLDHSIDQYQYFLFINFDEF